MKGTLDMQTTTTLTKPSRWSKTALLWMPTFLGYPLGGLAARLIVGRVDALVPAIVGGAITGTILGFAQWLGMRHVGPPPLRWIVATGVGFALGLGLGASTVGYDTTIGALAVQGAICGAVIGVAQAIVLHRDLGRLVWAWLSCRGSVGARLDHHLLGGHRRRRPVQRLRLERRRSSPPPRPSCRSCWRTGSRVSRLAGGVEASARRRP
jgi:hypothetical protein